LGPIHLRAIASVVSPVVRTPPTRWGPVFVFIVVEGLVITEAVTGFAGTRTSDSQRSQFATAVQ